MKPLKVLGLAVFWLGWPVFYFYFKNNRRTRILVLCGDKLLLVKPWINNNRWLLPGGGIKVGESERDSVLRELAEETGLVLDGKAIKQLGEGSYRQYGINRQFVAFFAKVRQESAVAGRLSEIAEVAWISRRLLTELNTGPDVIICLKLYKELRPRPGQSS